MPELIFISIVAPTKISLSKLIDHSDGTSVSASVSHSWRRVAADALAQMRQNTAQSRVEIGPIRPSEMERRGEQKSSPFY